MQKVPTYFFILISLQSCLMKQNVDLIIHNALIYTVDSTFSKAQAIAVKKGRILALGTDQEILNKFDANESMDAHGKPVYPGFIDAHCHFLGYGLSLQQADLTATKSYKEVIDRLVEFQKKSKSKDSGSSLWITGRGWDQNLWEINPAYVESSAGKVFPENSTLDNLFPETPVCILRIDGHAALANSEALKRANIHLSTKIAGGIIEIKNGRLTGILIDNAI